MSYKVSKQPGQLVLSCTQPLLKVAALAIAIALLYALSKGTVPSESILGLVLTVFMLIVLVLSFQEAYYTFDLVKRQLRYRRFGPLLKGQAGTIDFDAIESIFLEDCLGDDAACDSRIALKCDGKVVPLSNAYFNKQIVQDCYVQLHEAVKGTKPALEPTKTPSTSLIAKSAKTEVVLQDNNLAAVDELIKQKKFIEAIKLVRHQSGVDLKCAKEFVDRRINSLK